MLKETGRIVEVHSDAIWVETIKQSTCGSCAAKKGCGQTLLKNLGVQTSFLRVPIDNEDRKIYKINDDVVIGIGDNIVVQSALFIYLIPLVLLLVFSGFGHTYINEAGSIILGAIGFFLGGFLVRLYSFYSRNDQQKQPFLINPEVNQEAIIIN